MGEKHVDVVGWGGNLGTVGDELKLCYRMTYSKEPFGAVQLAKSSSCDSSYVLAVLYTQIFMLQLAKSSSCRTMRAHTVHAH